MLKNLNIQKIHLFFLSILSLHYILPLILFGNVTLFYYDTLDSEIVFNTIIANSFKDNFESLKLFLNGEIRIEFLRRAFQPFTLFYFFLSPEIAYFTIDILVKITAYFSFFIFAKKINSNLFICGLVAAIFSSLNERTLEGFGFAFMPYIIYLISFKSKINLKHIFLIIIFGINTDIVKCLISIPLLVIAAYILKTNKEKIFFKKVLQVLSIFIFSIIVSNFNLIYSQIALGEFQREAFVHEYYPLYKNIAAYFIDLFHFNYSLDSLAIKNFPITALYILIFLLIFLGNKDQKSLKLVFLIIFTNLIPFFFRSELIVDFRNTSSGILKTFQFQYVTTILFLIFSIILIKVLNNWRNSLILKFLILILFFFQINSSIVPSFKKFFIVKENYRNIYTFNGYYMYEDYKKIKSYVLNSRTMSIGYDPMIAVMNSIHVIDGYHNLYPLEYKYKFKKIINEELNKNLKYKNYYNYWGNRLYAFVTNEKKIDLNFKAANSLGAKYIISKFKITNSDLKLVSDDFKNMIYLYELNY